MKIVLKWQNKAVIVFALAILILSVILFTFALRQAEREKATKENERNEEQQRTFYLINDQLLDHISAVEQRFYRLAIEPQIQFGGDDFSDVCQRIKAEEDIISEIFWIDERKEVFFPLLKPLFTLDENRHQINLGQTALAANPLFLGAEELEFRDQNYPAAIQAYQKLMESSSDSTYCAILLNSIGRCYTKARNPQRAISAYRRILNEFPWCISPDRIPFDLIALCQVGTLCFEIEKKEEGIEAFLELYSGLLEPKWILNRDQFLFYLEKVKNVLAASAYEIDESEQNKAIVDRWSDLNRLESERLDRMQAAENIGLMVAPLLDKGITTLQGSPDEFRHFTQTIDNNLYMLSCAPFDQKIILGFQIDTEFLSQNLLPSILERLPLRKEWFVQIEDESGKIITGEDISILESKEPQLTYSEYFRNNFPPWEITVFQSDINAEEKQFRLRRKIYVSSVAVVLVAILFGGLLAIRSTAKELDLARLKSDFVSTVSHEFRTPLTSIRYLTELLQRGRIKDEKKKKLYYDTLFKESEHLNRLVDNILDFSRIEAGMKEYQFQEIDLSGLVRETVARFQTQAAPKGFSVETTIPEDFPKVTADKEALALVLLNLMDNAFKYSGDSQKAYLYIRFDDDNVYLEVQDEGIGISQDEQKKVFDKFYRAENAQKNSVKGSGIGLTLVNHIVRAHRGDVTIESERGKGTKVTIKLPQKRKKDQNG